jgi:hypothetical protein
VQGTAALTPLACTQVGAKRSAPSSKSKQSTSKKVRISHKKKVVPAPCEEDVQEVVHGLNLNDIEDLLEHGEFAQVSLFLCQHAALQACLASCTMPTAFHDMPTALLQGSNESGNTLQGCTLQGRISLDESVHADVFDDSFDALVGFGTLLEAGSQGGKATAASTVPSLLNLQPHGVCDFDTIAESLGDLMGMSGNRHDSWDSAIALEEYL